MSSTQARRGVVSARRGVFRSAKQTVGLTLPIVVYVMYSMYLMCHHVHRVHHVYAVWIMHVGVRVCV